MQQGEWNPKNTHGKNTRRTWQASSLPWLLTCTHTCTCTHRVHMHTQIIIVTWQLILLCFAGTYQIDTEDLLCVGPMQSTGIPDEQEHPVCLLKGIPYWGRMLTWINEEEEMEAHRYSPKEKDLVVLPRNNSPSQCPQRQMKKAAILQAQHCAVHSESSLPCLWGKDRTFIHWAFTCSLCWSSQMLRVGSGS